MDKEVNDFLVFVGDVDEDLDNFALGVVVGGMKVKNKRVNADVLVRDVNVVRSAGRTLWNWITGKPTIQGGMELDKVRNANFSEELIFAIKLGKPALALVFPDRFEQLPESIKKDKYFGTAFQITYMQMQALNTQKELLEEAGFNQTEIWDKLSQSHTKSNEYITKLVQDYTKDQNKSLEREAMDRKKQEGSAGNEAGFY